MGETTGAEQVPGSGKGEYILFHCREIFLLVLDHVVAKEHWNIVNLFDQMASQMVPAVMGRGATWATPRR